ncbi:hypothetical protein PUNSTDRAFT_90162 [Punctularia strigosozonata HHB-11173 SS5]|uniref:uncharacterized protein n=1 Tax=Punctularia strigosozonata (strain HHB-11173) TaxID=741275 RepID=UPI0004416DEE|nr:uncharacterized protein PUNSTDRAFT_90162 [Punctularia strigosozonata HHB-11173 SS5]EIN06524.1 hypothetical protein PUNSTDRAFT_90162 [Punctularia strigosozonata HHB-11173 SS5]
MSSLTFLVTELQSLASETRRKHPEVREAAEKSLTIFRASPEQATLNLAKDGPQSDELLRPIFMGCATRNAKVVGIALGSLQRLISLRAVPTTSVPAIVQTMAECMSQGVDIQLRILQTLLSLITNYPNAHGQLLGDALLLCFKLQDSRIAVVSSTAAATLRQLVMFVVDKVVDEDKHDVSDEQQLSSITLPDGTVTNVGPSALDAYAIFEDLCLLANSEKPRFLKLEHLHKTFALELIESVLTNYHELFRKHRELLLLVQHHLCPLLLKALSDRPVFPLSLRATRVVFLLLKKFSSELKTEAEVFFMLLIRTVGGDADSGSGHDAHGSRPLWMRVLAMEIMRGLCVDAELMRNVWERYDAQNTGSKVFTALVTSLKRLVMEKPALLGVCSQMLGLGVHSGSEVALDSVGGVAGMVANAATATMSGVVGMIASGPGLSIQGSSMKLQWRVDPHLSTIDQLDKADSPPIPESYIYLLGIQCIIGLCEGFATFAAPIYTTIMVQKPRAAGDAVVRAPPALDLSKLPPEDPSTKQMRAVHDMVDNGWPALLAALTFVISTNLSDELFADVLASFQALTNVSGMLGLKTPRDAFFASLAKVAIPSIVVSSVDSWMENQTPRTASSFSEGLGLSAPAQSPGLSERNMACLKVFISSAVFLAGSLNECWFDVLETLQNAEYVITLKGTRTIAPKSGSVASSTATRTGESSSSAGHPLLQDLSLESLQTAIQRLFDASKNMEDPAFHEFLEALCRLSAEMIEMQSEAPLESRTIGDSARPISVAASPSVESGRRRVSGIQLPRTLRSGDFGISKLSGVARLNIHRLIYRPPNVAWDTIIAHLLAVIRNPTSPPSIRSQSARILDDILVTVPRNLSSTGDLKATVQGRVFDALSRQVIPTGQFASDSSSTGVELRKMGLEALHQILQASGHTLLVGWESIFEMLSSVCKPAAAPSGAAIGSTDSPVSPAKPRPPPLGYANEKAYASLVKIAFQSLTLVCDSLSLLAPEHLRLCISTLGNFGRQADTNIALTAAESLLWGVSDSIQAKRKDREDEEQYNELWMFLLLEILGLCTDARQEVRMGAIQTLFRTLQLYGATLSLETWEDCVWKITFPLLDAISDSMRNYTGTPASTPTTADLSLSVSDPTWGDSKILALQSIGNIFSDFLSTKIIHLCSFIKLWDVFVGHVQRTVLSESRKISPHALRCLEKVIKSATVVEPTLDDAISVVWTRTWEACSEIGGSISRKDAVSPSVVSHGGSPPGEPFTQESLVALVDVLSVTRAISRTSDKSEWPLDRLRALMAILKDVLTYTHSPDYRPDVDVLSPVQAVVMDMITTIDLYEPGVVSLVLRDLSEYVSLPFLAAFDAPETGTPSARPSSQRRRITYIGLSKKCMPMLADLYAQFKEQPDIYNDGTVEAIFSAYSIPVKLKYDCPPSSKLNKDTPLWKTATTNFLRVVKDCAVQIKALGERLTDDGVERVWRQIIDVFRGGILADCSPAEFMTLEQQAAEENFDLALVAALEVDVIPHLGDPRVPESLVVHLARVLQEGSRLQDFSMDNPDGSPHEQEQPSSPDDQKVTVFADRDYEVGTTHTGRTVPRERFAYWCFDLLFLICSDTARDQEPARRRVAALSVLPLLTRCRTTLISYIADEALRGNLPFPRVREEELLYVLRKLLELRLWTGTLWAALSDTPSTSCLEQPSIDAFLAPSALVADAVKRSARAHLFHLYPVLCEIATVPRKPPSAWVDTNGTGQARELDARSLARDCLKALGVEMGIQV